MCPWSRFPFSLLYLCRRPVETRCTWYPGMQNPNSCLQSAYFFCSFWIFSSLARGSHVLLPVEFCDCGSSTFSYVLARTVLITSNVIYEEFNTIWLEPKYYEISHLENTNVVHIFYSSFECVFDVKFSTYLNNKKVYMDTHYTPTTYPRGG